MTITVNGQPYELTPQNHAEIDRQQCIETGRNMVEYMEDYLDEKQVKELTEDDYYEIGSDFIHANDYYPEPEESYYNILERYDLVKEEE